jgi:ATP-dependent helicase/nuclease subunit A
MKIAELVKTGERSYGDFAVLQRSYTQQRLLEKYFRMAGIPYATERPASLFEDAPLNDMYHLLHLAVYPDDRLSYAAVIRSAFAGLSDETLAVCMGARDVAAFSEELEASLAPAERENYARMRLLLDEVRVRARTANNCELVTYLWYETGYRYETLWNEEAQSYGSLYDLFFELARQSDARGEGLAAFVDSVSPDALTLEDSDLSIPGEPEDSAPVRVQCMSIHKSKGLQFPVVFIFGAGSKKQQAKNTGLVFYDDYYGPTINVGEAEDMPVGTRNFFYQQAKNMDEAKERAELRRLLYVAMTRAEEEVYITATDDKKEDAEPAMATEAAM